MEQVNYIDIVGPKFSEDDPPERYIFSQYIPTEETLEIAIKTNRVVIVHIRNGQNNRLVNKWFKELNPKYTDYVSLWFLDVPFDEFQDKFLNELRCGPKSEFTPITTTSNFYPDKTEVKTNKRNVYVLYVKRLLPRSTRLTLENFKKIWDEKYKDEFGPLFFLPIESCKLECINESNMIKEIKKEDLEKDDKLSKETIDNIITNIPKEILDVMVEKWDKKSKE